MKKVFSSLCLFFLSLSPLYASDAGLPPAARLTAALGKASKAYESVRDYRATFQKQERSGAVLGPKETLLLKFQKPFKIFMIWTNTYKKGLQVMYERGKNDGKLVVHQPGLLLGLVSVILLDQDSPWVKEGSESYDIEDAGLGAFLEDFSAAVKRGVAEHKLEVAAAEEASGETMDVTFAGSKENEGFFAQRVQVHFDAVTALPDRMELFDWQNEPMGIYAYEDLALNVGDEDAEFQKMALKKIYQNYWLPRQSRPQTSSNFSGKSRRATPTGG